MKFYVLYNFIWIYVLVNRLVALGLDACKVVLLDPVNYVKYQNMKQLQFVSNTFY